MTFINSPHRGGRASVLLAEDHPLMRMGLRSLMLRAPDLNLVAEVADGAAALKGCLELHPDVALLDLRLPDMTALELLTALRERGADQKALLLTGYATPECLQRAWALGALGLLHKDAPSEQVLFSVREAALGREVWSAEQRRTLQALERQPHLSRREVEVLRVLCTGATNKEIGELLGLSPGTVRVHVSHIFSKLGVGDRTSAVTEGVKRGLVELG